MLSTNEVLGVSAWPHGVQVYIFKENETMELYTILFNLPNLSEMVSPSCVPL